MRVTKYSVEVGTDGRNVLVKESARNCGEISGGIDSKEKAKMLLDTMFRASYQAEEYVWLIALNTKLKPVGVFEVSHGIVDASIVRPREFFVRLLLCGATGFIIAHNHPSGDTTPSSEDIDVTTRISECAKLMGVRFFDHVILGPCSMTSHLTV